MKAKMAQWPHQEAEGTRRTRSSAVHVRLCGGQCTEHWSLFARTPRRSQETRKRMKTKMHSFLTLNNFIDLVMLFGSFSLFS